MTAFRVLLLAGACLALALPGPAQSQNRMVAAANPHAARAGLEILHQGGSAVDAAVAVQLVLNVVEPQSSGIGGGAFMLHFEAETSRTEAYDGRETAPAAATESLFLHPDGSPIKFFEAVVGGRSVGAPGVLRMLEKAHQRHGRLPWRQLFQPAIALARDGFAVSQRLHMLLARDKFLAKQPAAGGFFYDADGQAWPVGHVLKNPDLAETFTAIAKGGAEAFYSGPIAHDVVSAVTAAANPGLLTLADLAGYRAKLRQPVCAPYRSYRICGMPPPTSGGITTLQILGILESFDLAALAPGSLQAVHLISEASRLAYADRARYLADGDFVAVPVAGLLRSDYLAQRAASIDPKHSLGRATAGLPEGRQGFDFAPAPSLNRPATSHFSIVDAKGNAVAMTSSVENAFGSRLLVRGFLLNNQLTDFSFRPQRDGLPVANRVAAGKRPRSSMAPTMVFRGQNLVLALGSPGGSRIIGYVAKTIIAVLDWKLDVQSAVNLPHHVNRNGTTDLEEGTALAGLADGLKNLGHKVRMRSLNSGLHAIALTPGGLDGAADPRREGLVVGD